MPVEFETEQSTVREVIDEDDQDMAYLISQVPPRPFLLRPLMFRFHYIKAEVETWLKQSTLLLGSFFFPVLEERRWVVTRTRRLTITGKWTLMNQVTNKAVWTGPNYRDLYVAVNDKLVWVHPALRNARSQTILKRILRAKG